MTTSPYKLNLHELPRRAGDFKDFRLDFAAPESIGNPMIEIPVKFPILITLKAESVSDGILVTGIITGKAVGECGRCLDPMTIEINQNFQELFFYENRADEDEEFTMEGDIADLEIPIRDAVILALPINPICSKNCRGLCSGCGEKWENLPGGHEHELIDPRWRGLSEWKSDPRFGR
ncbi:MAG: DUF177 domain-containing protein [Actinobacteria bacterium]|nr:DUF177 domain-containing protein [Actinomycetota bacterium]